MDANDHISKFFEKELIGYLIALYFPVMFGIMIVIYRLDLLKFMNADALFFITLVLPAILISLGVLLKFRFVYKISYKPKLKSLAFFLTVTGLVIVLTDVVNYFFTKELNHLHIAIFLGSYIFYRISDGSVNRSVVSKFLAVTSLFFLVINTTFALVFRSIFHTIISMLWFATLVVAILFSY